MSVHFSSDSVEWATPQDLFDLLDTEFSFTLDVCAAPANAKVSAHYTEADDGLSQNWGENVCWMNPPYGRGLTGKWMQKARDSAASGATVVCLIPARTDTVWWHDTVWDASEVRFIKGRLKFGDSTNSAPFPSAIVVYRPPLKKTWASGSSRVAYTVNPVVKKARWVQVALSGTSTGAATKP